MNLDWTVSWYDDRAIAAWIKEKFKAYEEINLETRKKALAQALQNGDFDEEEEGYEGNLLGFIEEFNALPRGVLRCKTVARACCDTVLISYYTDTADTFRYLKLLMDGGIYTDSDTSCVRPLLEWPGLQTPSPNAHILSDPLFTLAPYLLSLFPDKNPAKPESEEEAPSNQPSSGQTDVGVLSGEMLQEAISASLDDATDLPALVLAVEFDAPHTKADWKKRGYARSMQFVQVRFTIVKALNYTHVE